MRIIFSNYLFYDIRSDVRCLLSCSLELGTAETKEPKSLRSTDCLQETQNATQDDSCSLVPGQCPIMIPLPSSGPGSLSGMHQVACLTKVSLPLCLNSLENFQHF